MEDKIVLLDPIGVAEEVVRAATKHIADLDGKIIGFLYNGHSHGVEVFETLKEELPKRFKFSGVISHVKKNLTHPADKAVIDELTSKADAVVVGIGA